MAHYVNPLSVWTGSYNFTGNAINSLENALVLRDNLIATAYAEEFAQIYALSEALDWKTDWIEPEYRLGS